MKKEVILVENGKGNFDLRKFGATIAGYNGDNKFDLVIRTSDFKLNVNIFDVNIEELFERFNCNGKDFKSDKYTSTNFIEVSKSASGYHLKTTKKLLNLFKIANSEGRIRNTSNCEAIAVYSNKEFYVLNSSNKKAA